MKMRNKNYYIIHSSNRTYLNLLYGFCENCFGLRYIATPPEITDGCGLSLRVELDDINLLRDIVLRNLNLVPKDKFEIYLVQEKGIERVYDLF